MPVNKYYDNDRNRLIEMVNIKSDMFTPKLDDILGPDRLVKGEMLQYNYGIPAYNEMRGMHSTLAMAMALDSVKQCHNNTPIFHMPHEPMMFDYYDMHEKYSHIPVASICLPVDDFNISDVIKRNVDNFKERPYLYIDSFIDDGSWGTPAYWYDEEKVKAYKIPSKDRLDMLVRVSKFIIGSK